MGTRHFNSFPYSICMHQPTNDPQNESGSSVERSPIASADSVELIDQDSVVATPVEPSPKDFRLIDPRFIPAERLSSLILLIVTTLGSIVVYLAMMFSDADQIFMVLAAVGLTLLCLSLLWNTIFWPQIEYRHIQWRLSEVGLEIRRGVFWKKEIAIPWARAQHADVSQGPLQRMFEIGSLTIHTAGTKNSSVTIDGLAHEQAVALRDEIIRQRKESDVV